MQISPLRIANTISTKISNQKMVMRWPNVGPVAANWGDKLNPYLGKKLTGREVVNSREVYEKACGPVHYWVGSHLSSACSSPNSVVWGTGFLTGDIPAVGKPGLVKAVRGWHSVERMRKLGHSVPDVVGDVALLLPRFYTPKPSPKKYSLGVIAHFRESGDPFFANAAAWEDTLSIDICGDIETVIDQIASCDRIISSSLHGIICSDGYGIPSYWIRPSDKPAGDGFKFHDYFSSVGRESETHIPVEANTSRHEIEDKFQDYSINIDLDALWKARPEVIK